MKRTHFATKFFQFKQSEKKLVRVLDLRAKRGRDVEDDPNLHYVHDAEGRRVWSFA